MVSTSDYLVKINLVGIENLTPVLKEGYAFVKEITENFTTWELYEDETIKAGVDAHFELLDAYLEHLKTKDGPKQTKKAKQKKEAPAKQKEKQPKPASIPKNSRKKATTQAAPGSASSLLKATKTAKPKKTTLTKPQPVLVEHVQEEVKLIKRFVGLHGKTKTGQNILALLKSLQRAITQKFIKKTSVYAEEIRRMQNVLYEAYTKAKSSAVEITIPEAELAKLVGIAGGEAVYPSIQLIKRYIGMQGKEIEPAKVQAFIAQIEKAIQNQQVMSTDPYLDKIQQILKHLKQYSKQKQSSLAINPVELNGLQGILAGCACRTPSGLGSLDPAGMTGKDLMQLNYQTIGLEGSWFTLLGDPAIGFCLMIHGKPGQGKSTFALLLAKYLSQAGKVNYVSTEEYGSYTLKDKVVRIGGADEVAFTPGLSEVNPAAYDFVFIDSVNDAKLDYVAFKSLKERYPATAFILVMQATKAGSFKGEQEWEHLADTVVRVENGVAQTTKNRYADLASVKVF
jgi:flagellin-specific chaperone FliS